MDTYKNLFNLLKIHNYELFEEEINKLDDNFDLNIRDENDVYLLQHIIFLNNFKLCELLLKKKCRIDITDKEHKSILYVPIIYGYTEIIEILVKYNKIIVGMSILDIKDKSGNTALHYAIINKNYKITKLFIENDADVNIVDWNGYNSLHFAVQSRSKEISELIIKSQTNCNQFTKIGESALHVAVNLQLYDICKILLVNGCDPNCQDLENELTPLHYISHNNNNTIAKLLLDYNANLNIQDVKGNTPIHYALSENNFDVLIVFLLSTHVINYNLWNINSMIPLHIVLNDINLYNKLTDITSIDISNIIFKSNLSIQDSNGNTCLYLLIKNNIWKTYIDTLKKKKLDIFVVNNNNEYITDIINSGDYDLFIDTVTFGYINTLKRSTSLWRDELDLMCSYEFNTVPKKFLSKLNKSQNNFDEMCFSLIKKKILQNIKNKKTSFCKSKSYPDNKICVNIDEGLKINYCTYTGSTLDVLVGLIYLLKKHPTTCSTLSHNFTKNKELCKFYKSRNIIINSKCEFLNFEILWINYKLYIIDKFNVLLKKCINNNKINIIIPLGIEMKNGSHANYIIFNIKTKTVERFEPHGSTFPIGFNYDPDLLDESLKNHFLKFDSKITYIKPKDYMPKIGFQIMDMLEQQNKKIGDPGGFCALWSLWYVDMRLIYKDIDRKLLVDELIKTIKYNKISFKNLIRNYSKNITDLRDNILVKANMDINDWLNDVITNLQIEKLIGEIISIINNL
jgi:ankyrin repeat protein